MQPAYVMTSSELSTSLREIIMSAANVKNTRMEVCRAKEKGGGAQMVWEGVYSRFASLSLSLHLSPTDRQISYINI